MGLNSYKNSKQYFLKVSLAPVYGNTRVARHSQPAQSNSGYCSLEIQVGA